MSDEEDKDMAEGEKEEEVEVPLDMKPHLSIPFT
jgi:hypothetical protein